MRQSRSDRAFRSALMAYSAIAVIWSWSFWLGSSLLPGQGTLIPSLVGQLGTFGPGAAAIVVSGREAGWPGIRRLLALGARWRLGWQWYLVVLLSPPILLLLALVLYQTIGGTFPRLFLVNHGSLVPLNFVLVLLLGGPLGEEYGWRGFLLPLLQSRLNALWSAVGVGIFWGCWHLPLFFMPGQLQQQLPFGLFLLNTIALSVLFTWIFNNTQSSVWGAIVLHTSVNYWSGVFPVLPESSGSLQPFAIAVLLLWVCAGLVIWRTGAAHLVGWQHRRTSR